MEIERNKERKKIYCHLHVITFQLIINNKYLFKVIKIEMVNNIVDLCCCAIFTHVYTSACVCVLIKRE